MAATNISKFQFLGYNINRSLIEISQNAKTEDLKISFNVTGLVQKNAKKFLLNLAVKIQNSDILIEVEAVGKFTFSTEEIIDKIDDISPFFYINSSALLFPYLRAYISTLTNLSANTTVNLPTLNLTSLGEELKKSTIIED